VIRIGEQFYKDYIEKLSLENKAAIILALCFNKVLSHDDELYKTLKNLRENRNQVVHPKTKVFDWQNEDHLEKCKERDIREDKVGEFIADMERVQGMLCELDGDYRHMMFAPSSDDH